MWKIIDPDLVRGIPLCREGLGGVLKPSSPVVLVPNSLDGGDFLINFGRDLVNNATMAKVSHFTVYLPVISACLHQLWTFVSTPSKLSQYPHCAPASLKFAFLVIKCGSDVPSLKAITQNPFRVISNGKEWRVLMLTFLIQVINIKNTSLFYICIFTGMHYAVQYSSRFNVLDHGQLSNVFFIYNFNLKMHFGSDAACNQQSN